MKIIKRVLALVLALAIMCSVCVVANAATQMQVSFGSYEAKAGDTVVMPVTVENNPTISSANVQIKYDKNNLTLTAVETYKIEGTSLKEGLMGAQVNVQDGRLTYANTDGCSGDILFWMTFKVNDDAVNNADTGYAVTIEVVEGASLLFGDTTGATIDCNIIPGVIKVTGGIKATPAISDPSQTAYEYSYDETPPTLSVDATVEAGTLSYQWYSNTTNSTEGGTPINGATSKDYVAAATTYGTVYYYCVVSNACNGGTYDTTSYVYSVTYKKGTQSDFAITNVNTVEYGKTLTLTTQGVPEGGTVTYEVVSGGTGAATISGNVLTATKAGTVKIKATKVVDNYNDATAEMVITITKVKVTVPSVEDTSLVYNGETYTVFTAPEGAVYSVEGNTGKNVGTYTLKLTLPSDNYVWSDPEFTGEVEWYITQAEVPAPVIDNDKLSFVYDTTEHTVFELPNGALYHIESGATGTTVGTYTLVLKLNDPTNYKWSGNFNGRITWYITKAQVTAPSAKEDLVYNGNEQTGVKDDDYYTVENGTGTEAKSYDATVSLDDPNNYEWTDKTTGDKTISWSITPATITYTGEKTMTVYNNGKNFNAPTWTITTVGGQKYTVTYAEKEDEDDLIRVTKDGVVTGTTEGSEGEAIIIATITAPNHETLTVDIEVTVSNKLEANVVFAANGTTKTYTGDSFTLDTFIDNKATSVPSGDIVYKFNGKAYSWDELLKLTVTDAGTYTVTAVYESDTHYGEKAITFTVKQAIPEVTVEDLTMAYTGNAVAVSQLDKTSSVEGTWAWAEGTAEMKNAGTYESVGIVFTPNDSKNYESVTKTLTVTINKIKVAVPTAKSDLVYKKDTAQVGVASADTGIYTVIGGTAINAGSYEATAVLNDKANYVWDLDEDSADDQKIGWSIAQKTVDVSGVKWDYTAPFTYTTGGSWTVTLVDLPEGAKVIRIANNTATAACGKIATAQLAAENSNYQLVNGPEGFIWTLEWAVEKAAAPADITLDAQYKYTVSGDRELTFTLPADAGEVTFGPVGKTDAKGVVSEIQVVNGKVTITLSGEAAADDTAAYTIPVTMSNYEGITITVNVKLLDREVPETTLKDIVVTYTGEAVPASSIAPFGTANVTGQWAWVTDVSEMKNAGEYTVSVKFVPENQTEYADVVYSDVKLTIEKAVPSITPDHKAVSSGKTLADAELSVKTSSVPGTIAWKLPSDTKVESNKAYDWVFTPEDTTNYETVEGSIILYRVGGYITPPINPNPGSGQEESWVNPYTDIIEGTWYYKAVELVTVEGMMNGTGGGKFAPGAAVTRSTLMTILARLDGVNTNGGSTWYQKGMVWAVANGISDGTNPTADITREQIVTMLWRYVGSPNRSYVSLYSFVDEENVSSWALDAVKWAVGQGLLNGKDGSRLDPTGTATRAELATILARFLEYVR